MRYYQPRPFRFMAAVLTSALLWGALITVIIITAASVVDNFLTY